jgi:predicted metalloprotease
MRWQGNRQSDNVEDARDEGGDGGRQGFSLGGGRLSLGTVAIALVASYFLGINPLTVLNMLSGGGGLAGNSAPSQVSQEPGHGASRVHPPGEDQKVQFVATVLADTEDVWGDVFKQAGGQYENPKLKIFRGGTSTGCGQGETAMGPFYCPADHKVYIDLAFYDTLRERLGAPGEFAQAYVIAHEVGHHVQNLLGTSAKLDEARGKVSKAQYNALSVRLELQADCFAGIWANRAQRSRQIIEAGDIESALNAAAQIGDDTLQRKSQGQVVPESFTHGTSEQRVRWFKRGYESGEVNQCNTFTKQPV